MNARMYAVTPAVEAAWRELLERVTRDAGVRARVPPLPCAAAARGAVDAARSRGGVHVRLSDRARACAGRCRLPRRSRAVPWAAGRALYRTDLIVREDAPYRTSRGHLRRPRRLDGGAFALGLQRLPPPAARLPHARRGRRSIARCSGNLVTARNVLDAVREGRIDVGPLDAYWHLLIARHAPELTARRARAGLDRRSRRCRPSSPPAGAPRRHAGAPARRIHAGARRAHGSRALGEHS